MQRMCVRHGRKLRLGRHELINIFFTDGRNKYDRSTDRLYILEMYRHTKLHLQRNWFVLRTLKHISFRDRTTGFDTIVLYTVEI